MPTKRARFGFCRGRWEPPGRGLTADERKRMRAICPAPAFEQAVLALMRWYDDGRYAARALSESPHEAELALRALHADVTAIDRYTGAAAQLPARARFLERLETLSATAVAYLHVGALRTGLRKADLIDLGATDAATRVAWAAALTAGAAEAAAAKSTVHYGAALERGTAEQLAAIFAEHGARFTVGNGNNARENAAVIVLGIVMPEKKQKRATLARYALHAKRTRRRPG